MEVMEVIFAWSLRWKIVVKKGTSKTMIPKSKKTISNPTNEELRSLVAEMPQAVKTSCQNYIVNTKVTARSAESTFFVSDREIGQKCISNKEYQRIKKLQDDYILNNEMVLMDGCIGPDADFQVGCSLLVEKRNANIAAMQQQLYFSPSKKPALVLTVIDTPNLFVPGYPNNRIIMVDLDAHTTRILGSDYFGESKKGGLRMWNQVVYQAGGLGLHAGCKSYPDINGREKLFLIIGLSGTGKTTTTFRTQLNSLPVQDDFCALLPGGLVKATENGCFAKTFDLDRKNEPVIYDALSSPNSWLENVSVSPAGIIDFHDGSRTTNGRGTFGFDQIKHRDPGNLPKVNAIILLNRNMNIIPAVAKLKPEQAAAYFMLGETTGTSAGGVMEAGKFLRVPGTNPFFCQDDALQGNRFFDLLRSSDHVDVFLFNTGYVGGGENSSQAKKVTIKDSSSILEGILQNSISWKEDSQFGYFIAAEVPGMSDEDLLLPQLLYSKQKREAEYSAIAEKIQTDRKEYLQKFDGLYPSIKDAV
jgi:phosphoenolpyruvate carboxykinase (ATP)